VEYATREQAQNAVATLSNQNLMGRLVYVREDREAEPRFSNPAPACAAEADPDSSKVDLAAAPLVEVAEAAGRFMLPTLVPRFLCSDIPWLNVG
jgi:hypothetical protein